MNANASAVAARTMNNAKNRADAQSAVTAMTNAPVEQSLKKLRSHAALSKRRNYLQIHSCAH